VADVRRVRSESKPDPVPPGRNWSLVENAERSRVTVEDADVAPPSPPSGWHLLHDEGHRVVREHVVVRTWRRGNRTTRTERRWRDASVVALGVAGDHRSTAVAPERPVATVHERTDRTMEPNLVDVKRRAVETLVRERGGGDRLARRAVAQTLDTAPVTVHGDRPTGLRARAYRDLVSLRDRVRNVSVSVPRGRLVGETIPAAKLKKRLRARRSDLLDAPSRYVDVAERARYAARVAYLDRVLARLDDRVDRSTRSRQRLGDVVGDATGVSLDKVQRILRSRRASETPERHRLPASAPGAAFDLQVDGAPPYLTLATVNHSQVAAVQDGESVHPLAARNVNVFTVPYGDAVDAITGSVSDGRAKARVDLRTAALALRAANRTLAARPNATLRTRRDELRSSVDASLDDLEGKLRTRLRKSTPGLDARTVRRGVSRGLSRWRTTHATALAVANGSATRAIAVALAAERHGRWSAVERGRVRLAAGFALDAARRNASKPKQGAVNGTLTTTKTIVDQELKRMAGQKVRQLSRRAQRRWVGEVLSDVPAGLPVVPVPGYWYATVNVWHVTVRGHYERFVVRAPRGPPGATAASTAYVREAATVRLDADGDGHDETLGQSTPVAFRTTTVVAIAVPPNARGVGDVDGNADERSPGW
jgi:hypothetical protein